MRLRSSAAGLLAAVLVVGAACAAEAAAPSPKKQVKVAQAPKARVLKAAPRPVQTDNLGTSAAVPAPPAAIGGGVPPPGGFGGMAFTQYQGPAVMTVVGRTLYLLKGDILYEVSLDNFQVRHSLRLTDVSVPAPMTGFGGGGFGSGGFGGGGAGNDGGFGGDGAGRSY